MARSMVPHAHRDGHLLFYVSGPAGSVVVDGHAYLLSPEHAVAVNPWQVHHYQPVTRSEPTLVLVLYLRPCWAQAAGRQSADVSGYGSPSIGMDATLDRAVRNISRDLMERGSGDPEFDRLLSKLHEIAHCASWRSVARTTPPPITGGQVRDYRLRRALGLMHDLSGEPPTLEQVARSAGLSRPSFFKLFRSELGVTPNIYLNSIRLERAITILTTSARAIGDIGCDLGFASHASFTRFFLCNAGVPPSGYRSSARLARSHVGAGH
jgi:AraC-like DNA-binding protein